MGWSITSNKSYSLGTIDDNGLATFSEHTEDIVYTITYSDGNYTCSKSMTVHACRPDCLCENVDLRAEATAGGDSIPAVGYDTDTVIGTFDDTTCLSSLTVSANQSWVKGVRISGHNVYAQIDENESILSARTATITITGKDGENVDCPDDFTITQQMSASTCTCENVDLRAEATQAGSSIPAEGYNNSTIIGTYDNGTCLTSVGVRKRPEDTWVTNLSVSNGNVYAKISPNTSTESNREAQITVYGKDAYDATCIDPFFIYQEISAITCTCDYLTVYPTSLNFSAAATSQDTQVITLVPLDSCITDISVGTVEHFNANIGGNQVVVSPKGKNTTTSAYTDTLVISYSASSIPCSSSITLSQDGISCDCGLVEYQQVRTEKGILDIFEKSGQTEVKIGTVTINGDCSSESVTFTSNNTGIVTNIRITGLTNGVGDVIADLPYVENPCKGTYTYSVDGISCNQTYEIRRMCYCGTDNCTQPGVYEHPLHMEYCNAWCQNGSIVYSKPTSGSYSKIASLDSGDHFFVNHGELLYNGNPPANGDRITPTVGSDWCWGTYVYGGSGCPHINYECLENTGSTRTATFTFTTPPNTRLNSNCLSTPWSGRSCCETFIVEVIQSAVGNGWEKIYPVGADSYYVEVPLTGFCTSTKCSGGNTIGLANGQCVSSAITSNKVELGSWTKSPAGCTDSWSYDGSRTISGSNFIDVTSLEFRSDGKIYGKVSVTNSTTSTRSCQIPTKLGSVKDYFTVIQCAGGVTPPPTPTTYSYTIISTNDNANGALVTFTSNGTTITSSTISNRSCTVTLSNHYSNLNATITKSGCDSVSTTVSANNSATITMTCTPPTPTCSASLTMNTSITGSESRNINVGTYTTNCEGTPTVRFNNKYSNFLSNIRCNNGVVIADVVGNTTTSSRNGEYKLTVGEQTATSVATQLGCSCTDTNVNISISQHEFDESGGIGIRVGTVTFTCPNCNYNKITANLDGATWLSMVVMPYGNEVIIVANVFPLPEGTQSRSTLVQFDYDNSEVGSSIRFTQTRS